jgi:hypothetical protein
MARLNGQTEWQAEDIREGRQQERTNTRQRQGDMLAGRRWAIRNEVCKERKRRRKALPEAHSSTSFSTKNSQ